MKVKLRWIIKVATLLIALVVTVVVIRTCTYSPIDYGVTKVTAAAKLLRQDEAKQVIKRFAEALTYRTVSDDIVAHRSDFEGFASFLQATYPRVYQVLTKRVFADYTQLLTWQGSEPDLAPVVLLAHQDVVPVDELTSWQHPPFSGFVDDQYVWGRGAMDFKLGVIGILEAVDRLIAVKFTPKRTIYIVLGHDEEVGGSGAAMVAAYLKEKAIKPEFVLDECPPADCTDNCKVR